MASPTADTYSSASGVVLQGGRGTPLSASLVLTGPSSGLTGTMSGLFLLTHTGTLSGPVTVSLSDGAAYVSGWSAAKFFPMEYGDTVSSSAQMTVTLTPTRPMAFLWYVPPSAGTKSITLTNTGGLQNPAAHTYTATAYVAPSATPFRLTRGGSTIGSYATLQRCKDIGGWQAGDIVKATAGTYVVYDVTDPGNTMITDNAGGVQTGMNFATTIEWEAPGSPMVLDCSHYCAVGMWGGGQPQLLTMGIGCHDLTVRGLHFRGARVPIGTSWLGAGIWTLTDYPNTSGAAATLNVEFCKFQHLPDGIKTRTHYNFSAYIRSCVFEDNSDAKGLDHDIYTGSNKLTHVEGCTFRKTAGQGYPQNGMGHFIKSRARETVVKGNLLDGKTFDAGLRGGVAQSINTPNGGLVTITGNVINYYGSLTTESNGNPLRFGDDQHSTNVDTSHDPGLTAHSLLFAQNTVRQYLGRAADGAEPRVLQIYPTGIATTLLDGAGDQIPLVVTTRNNLVAYDTPGARLTQFMASYPDNTIVGVNELGDTGVYSGASVAGSPAISDATLYWAGDFVSPGVRSSTNRGAYA